MIKSPLSGKSATFKQLIRIHFDLIAFEKRSVGEVHIGMDIYNKIDSSLFSVDANKASLAKSAGMTHTLIANENLNGMLVIVDSVGEKHEFDVSEVTLEKEPSHG